MKLDCLQPLGIKRYTLGDIGKVGILEKWRSAYSSGSQSGAHSRVPRRAKMYAQRNEMGLALEQA
jgi:hypothetical protein